MFAPTTFAVALIMTVLSSICWGSFANTYKLTKNYRFELFYWDYAAGMFASYALALFLIACVPGSLTSRERSRPRLMSLT